jgi:hypothetical protein
MHVSDSSRDGDLSTLPEIIVRELGESWEEL